MKRGNEQWRLDLNSGGPARDAALEDLRVILTRGLRHALSSRHPIDDSQIEDFVQESLLAILNNLDDFRAESRFTTWALAVAVHTAFTELRRSRWKDASLDQMLEANFTGDAFVSKSDDPVKKALQEKIAAELYRAINEDLTEKQRQALTAEFIAEAPLEEIARRMGANRNALYKVLHDARSKLKRSMLDAGLTAEEINFAFDL